MHGLDEIVALNEEATERAGKRRVRVDEIREAVVKGIDLFVKYPPKSGVQIGFLAALNWLAKDVLNEDVTASPYKEAIALLSTGNTAFVTTRVQSTEEPAPVRFNTRAAITGNPDATPVPYVAEGAKCDLPCDHAARICEGAHSTLPENHPARTVHVGRHLEFFDKEAA